MFLKTVIYKNFKKIPQGEEKPIIRSKYEEDVYLGNHSSVYGSFWKNGQWGYKCCHSFLKVNKYSNKSNKTKY